MIQTLRHDIPAPLLKVTSAADAYVKRLTGLLEGRPGVEQAHVVAPELNGPAMLCIHFDFEIGSLSRIQELAHASGADIGNRFGNAIWQVDGMTHQRRARTDVLDEDVQRSAHPTRQGCADGRDAG